MLLLSLFCLGGCATAAVIAEPEPTTETIHIYIPYEIDGINRIAEAFEAETADTLGIDLEFYTISEAEYFKEIDLLLSLGEDIDLIYSSTSLNLSTLISNEQILPLDEYFNNPEYAGLYAAFSAEQVEANLYEDALYGLPLESGYTELSGIVYRQDILESAHLGFTQITNTEELLAYYDYIDQSDLAIYPLGLDSNGFCYTFAQTIDALDANIYMVPGYSTLSVPMAVVLSEDNTTVETVLFLGDDASSYMSVDDTATNTSSDELSVDLSLDEVSDEQTMDDEVIVYDFITTHYLENAIWSNYTQPNSILTTSKETLLLNGKVASIETTLGNGTIDLQTTLQESFPDATLSFYAYDTSQLSSMRAEAYLCIPASSEHVDAVVAFLDWLYANQENYDLFAYGIEGEDWQADENGDVILLDNPSGDYTANEYLTASTIYNRQLSGLSTLEENLLAMQQDESLYTKSPLADFLLDPTYISSEIVQLQNLYSEYSLQLNAGTYGDDTLAIIAEIGERSATCGIETVRAEIKKQIQFFLDTQS